MAKKTYRTYSLRGLQLLLHDKTGRAIEVNFSGGVQIDSTSKFSTRDENIQEALEKCSCFNRDFYLESVQEDAPAPVPSHAPAEEENDKGLVVKVADKATAVEWLKEHFPEKKYTATKLRLIPDFEAACKECDVTFEFTTQK